MSYINDDLGPVAVHWAAVQLRPIAMQPRSLIGNLLMACQVMGTTVSVSRPYVGLVLVDGLGYLFSDSIVSSIC